MAGNGLNPFFNASRQGLNDFEVLDRLANNDSRTQRTTNHLYALINARNAGKQLTLQAQAVMFDVERAPGAIPPPAQGVQAWQELNETNNAIKGLDNQPARLDYQGWHQGIGLPSAADQLFIDNVRIKDKEARIEDLRSIQIPGNILRSGVSQTAQNLTGPILNTLRTIYQLLTTPGSLPPQETPNQGSVFQNHQIMAVERMSAAAYASLMAYGHLLTFADMDVIASEAHKISNPTNLLVPGWYQMPGNSQYGPDLTRMRQLIEVIDGLLAAAKNRVGTVYEQRAPIQNPGAGGFFADRVHSVFDAFKPGLINYGAAIDRSDNGTATQQDYTRMMSYAAASAGAAALAVNFPMTALGVAAGGLGQFLLARQGQGRRGGSDEDEVPQSMAPVPSLFEGDSPSGPFQPQAPQAPAGMSTQDPRLALASIGSQKAVNSLPAPSSSAAGENTNLTIPEMSGPTLMRTVARPSFSFPSTLQVTPTLLTGAYRTLPDGTFADVPQQNKPPVTLSTNLPYVSEIVQTGTPPDIGPDTAPEGLEAYKTAADMTSLVCASLLSHPGYTPMQKVSHTYLMNWIISSGAIPDEEEGNTEESEHGGAKPGAMSIFPSMLSGPANPDSRRENSSFMWKALTRGILPAVTVGASTGLPRLYNYVMSRSSPGVQAAHQPEVGNDPWDYRNNKMTTENFGHMSYAAVDKIVTDAKSEAIDRAKFSDQTFKDAMNDFAKNPYSSVARALAVEARAWATKYRPEAMVQILKEYGPVLEEKSKLQAQNTELSQKNSVTELKGRIASDVEMAEAEASAATALAEARWSKFYNGLSGHLSGMMSPLTPIANGAYTLATDTIPKAVSNYLEAGKDAYEQARKAYAEGAALENKAHELDPATIALTEGFTIQPLENFPDYLAGDPTQMQEYYKNYWKYATREEGTPFASRQEYFENRTRINNLLAQSRAFFAEHPEKAEGREISATAEFGKGKPKTARKAQKKIGGDKQNAAEEMAEAQEDQQHNEEGVQENTTDVLASMTGPHRVPAGGDGGNFAETIAANAEVFNFTPAIAEFTNEVKKEYMKIVANKESAPGGIPADSDSYFMSAIQKACMRVAVSGLNSGTHLVNHIPSLPPPMRLEPNPLVPVSGTPQMAGPTDGVPLHDSAYEEVRKAENGQFTSVPAPGGPQGQKALFEAVQALNLQPGGQIMQGIPSRVSNGITSDIDLAAEQREQAALAEFQKRKDEQTAAAATQAMQTDKIALDAIAKAPQPPPPPQEDSEDEEEMDTPKEEQPPPTAVEAFKPPKQRLPGIQQIINAIRGVDDESEKKGQGRGTKRAPSAWSTLVKETYHELKKENPLVTLAQAAQVASKRRKTGEGAKKNNAEGVKHGGNFVTDLWNKATNELTNKDSLLNQATGNVSGKVSNELYNKESDLNKATWNAGTNLTVNLLDPLNTAAKGIVSAPVDIAEHAYQKGKELSTDYMKEGVGPDVLDPLTMVQICGAAYMTSNGKEPPHQIGDCVFVAATPYDVLYRLPSGNHVVGVRGTVLTDVGDLEADLLRIVPSNLSHSPRYAKDRDTVVQWKQAHPSAFYYATGHSLGGAICDELIKARLVSKAYTFNPAVQTTDFLTNLPNTRVYSDKDPLYILMGQFTRGSHVIKTKDNVTGLMKELDMMTRKSVDLFIKKHSSGLLGNPFPAGVLETAMSHQLHNFKDLQGLPVGYGKKRGGAIFDDIKNLAGKVTNEFVNPDSVLRQTPNKVVNEFVNPESVLNKAVESGVTSGLDALANTLDYWTSRQYKPSTAAFLAKHGGEQLANLKIRRYPVPGYIDQAFNLISAGKWGEAKKNASYDDFFHLGIIMDNKYVFEKNASLNFFAGVDNFPGQMFMDVVKTIPKGLTIGVAMEKTRAVIGNETFFRYDPFTNNCQNFVSAFLGVNNLITPDLDAYIYQPVDEVLKQVPSYVPAFGRTLTNFGAFFGMGKKKKSKRDV